MTMLTMTVMIKLIVYDYHRTRSLSVHLDIHNLHSASPG